MEVKEFKYSLKIINGSIYFSNYKEEIIIENDNLSNLVNAIVKINIKNFFNYNDDLIITFQNGFIVLRNYEKCFQLPEFDTIKKKYLRNIKLKNLKFITEKGKYIVLTSSLILGILCGTKVNSAEITNDSNKEYSIESVNTDKIYNFKDKQINNLNNNKEEEVVLEEELNADDAENPKNNQEDSYLVNLNYGDNTNSEKLKKAQKEYSDNINKFANKYGLDENLILAICTQERGTHSSSIDQSGACGLMQIQVSAHPNGSTIPTTTFDNEGNPSDNSFTFYKNDYQTLDGNIEAGCALIRYYLNEFHGNIIAALYAYNAGNGTVESAIKKYAKNSNITYNDVVYDYDNYAWKEYFTNSENDYLKAIMQYFDNDEIKYYIVETNEDNELTSKLVTCNLNNNQTTNIKK